VSATVVVVFGFNHIWRKQDLLKNEEEPERDNSEQNVPEGERGR
jgi:hypothetical protein